LRPSRTFAWLVGVAIVAGIPGIGPASASGDPHPLQIAFGHTFKSGNVDVVAVLPDGTGMVRLTIRPAFDACVAGSPKGDSRIAFCSDAGGALGIWTMRRNGWLIHRTTKFDGYAADPDFRAARSTHKRILFTADVGNGHDIYASNLRGRNLVQLTDDPAADDYAAWSPNYPERIAFVSDRSGMPQVFVMTTAGRRVKQLTHFPDGVTDGPDWNPDGSQIVFASGPAGAEDIFVMNADGSHVTSLTTDPASDVSPAWSPDGTQIAFLSTRVPGSRNVFVMNADGTGQHPITKPGSMDYAPAWLRPRGR
jgi:TolB protein